MKSWTWTKKLGGHDYEINVSLIEPKRYRSFRLIPITGDQKGQIWIYIQHKTHFRCRYLTFSSLSNSTQISWFFVAIQTLLPARKLQIALWWTKYATSTIITCLKGVSPVSSFLFKYTFSGFYKGQCHETLLFCLIHV